LKEKGQSRTEALRDNWAASTSKRVQIFRSLQEAFFKFVLPFFPSKTPLIVKIQHVNIGAGQPLASSSASQIVLLVFPLGAHPRVALPAPREIFSVPGKPWLRLLFGLGCGFCGLLCIEARAGAVACSAWMKGLRSRGSV
jgi:hypothetical protein